MAGQAAGLSAESSSSALGTAEAAPEPRSSQSGMHHVKSGGALGEPSGEPSGLTLGFLSCLHV